MKLRERLLSAAVLSVAALPGLLYIADPIARDQGVFALIGWRWLNGDVPYLAAGVEHKGPLPFAAYALSQILFGHSILAARLLAWMALVITGFLVTRITARIVDGRPLSWRAPAPTGAATGDSTPPRWRGAISTAAGALYLLIAGAGGLSAYWSGAQAEAFMEPLVAGAVLAALGGATFGAGLLLGAASLGKPLALLVLPALVAGAPRRRAALTALLAGVMVPWAAALAYFTAAGAGREFLDSVFLANLDYGRRGLSLLPDLVARFPRIHHEFVSGWFVLPALAAFPGVARQRGAGARLLVLWAPLAYAEVVVQARLFGYHFHPVVAPVAILAALGLGGAAAGGWRLPPGARKGIAVALAGSIALGLITLEWRETGFRLRHAGGGMPDSVFTAHFSPSEKPGDVDPVETLRAAGWAETNLASDQTLLVWGFEPAVNFLARRRSPTRFIYDYYLTSPWVAPERQSRYWRLFWSDIARTPPDCIAVVHNDRNPLESEDSAHQLESEPALRRFVAEHYRPAARVGDFEFLRRRPPDAPAAR